MEIYICFASNFDEKKRTKRQLQLRKMYFTDFINIFSCSGQIKSDKDGRDNPYADPVDFQTQYAVVQKNWETPAKSSKETNTSDTSNQLNNTDSSNTGNPSSSETANTKNSTNNEKTPRSTETSETIPKPPNVYGFFSFYVD